ncbi:translation initiation factor IF-2 [candidate division WOR-1 bacterium RIFOXYB2_FULL_48_7]|uniref:Translation initiation factor IF-2 n=1 Tax=candidate division WOR-1 bacterium RIFOXYB2_FULL_48_7 TaxID=1802583 RepID=A0A1F4TRM4_UNCSA|nr:MAG: translation initiation factor IF-2 [candidate division WOR-1 bacterium RIFOXYB2_FULL_48_7]
MKVSDLAKELNLTAKDLLGQLKGLGVAAKTASSAVDEETAKIIRELKSEPPAKAEPPKEPQVEPVKAPEPPPPPPAPPAKPVVTPPKSQALLLEAEEITVKDLAEKLNVKSSELIKELMKKGLLVTINQRIAAEVAKEVGSALGKEIVLKTVDVSDAAVGHQLNIEKRALRPPVVTVMGHVDHGKTKLLDAIRQTRVAEKEAGGITQHIGAYQVNVHGRKVTFLDTPGHEAFTALRARGASVTDIVILVVAADDGVKPQTIEAINHAKAAGVSIIVAINKVDKPEANPDRVKTQLSELGLAPEDWGGQTVTVPVSAKQQTGIKELLEMVLLVADIHELKADPDAIPMGIVIESRLDKGRGPVASVLVKNGTLKIGDVFACGSTYGKVRALFTDTGARLEKAGPSMPVEVLGFVDVPASGDLLQGMTTEKEARDLAEKRRELEAKTLRGKAVSLEDFSKHVKEGEGKDLTLVVKGDVQGSVDAIVKSLNDLTVGNIGVHIIHSGVGMINESDIMLAKASTAIIVGFNVSFEGGAENYSQTEGVEVRKYNIIYKLIDDVKLAMEGLLEPVYEEVIVGHAEVRNLFRFSKVGAIAGCFVTDGKMQRGVGMRIFRDKAKIYEGKLESLKRFKEDVKAVESNYECGIAIQGYEDFKVGDIIEAFEVREKSRG